MLNPMPLGNYLPQTVEQILSTCAIAVGAILGSLALTRRRIR